MTRSPTISGSSFAANGPDPPRRPQASCGPRRAGSLRSRGHTLGVERTCLGVQRTGGDSPGIPRRGRTVAPPGGGGPPSAARARSPAQIMLRRAVGVGVVVVILILIVLGVKGCLNARKQRSFENYASDLTAIVTQTEPAVERLLQPPRRPRQPLVRSASRPRSTPTADRGWTGKPSRRPRHPGRPEARPERAQPGLRAAPRRADRNRRKDHHRAGQPGPHEGASTRSPTTCSTSWPATSSTQCPGADRFRPSRTRESTRRRPTASSCPRTDWLDPLKVSSALAAGFRAARRRPAAPTAWLSTRRR